MRLRQLSPLLLLVTVLLSEGCCHSRCCCREPIFKGKLFSRFKNRCGCSCGCDSCCSSCSSCGEGAISASPLVYSPAPPLAPPLGAHLAPPLGAYLAPSFVPHGGPSFVPNGDRAVPVPAPTVLPAPTVMH
jgi:hypothetical protein